MSDEDDTTEDEVRVVEVKHMFHERTDAILQIPSVCRTFAGRLLFVASNKIRVILNTDTELHERIQSTNLDKQYLYEDFLELGYVQEFIAYRTDDGVLRIVPKIRNFMFAFDYVEEVLRNCNESAIVKVSLGDVQTPITKYEGKEIRYLWIFSVARGLQKIRHVFNKVLLPTRQEKITAQPYTEHLKLPITQPTDDIQVDATHAVSYNATYIAESTAQSQTDVLPPMPPARYPQHIDKIARLLSYSMMWNLKKPDPSELADAGFFYTTQADLVRCFQCGIGLKDFTEGDDPLLEHVRYSGECPYLLVLLGKDRLDRRKAQLRATDPNYNREAQLDGAEASFLSYRHPEYRTMEARLATFKTWSPHKSQTPKQLAEAGLYFTGKEDLVRCFACDGGLKSWDPEDDPWTEHCRWFPACIYCIEQKGQAYISAIQAVNNQEPEVNDEELDTAMEQLKIAEAEVNSLYNINKTTFRDMGFKETDVKETIKELYNRGDRKPNIAEIVDLIGIIKERRESEKAMKRVKEENPVEENRRLKGMLLCSKCHENKVNALFLPCTHHKLCVECAKRLETCPQCRRPIKQIIRTFLG